MPATDLDKEHMRFRPLGDSAIVAEWDDGVSSQTLQRVRDFATVVEQARLPGVIDIVPAFVTVTVFYAPAKHVGGEGWSYVQIREALTRIETEGRSHARRAEAST